MPYTKHCGNQRAHLEHVWESGRDLDLGNAVKYIARAGRKDPSKFIEDLEKARFYLDYHIAKVKGEH